MDLSKLLITLVTLAMGALFTKAGVSNLPDFYWAGGFGVLAILMALLVPLTVASNLLKKDSKLKPIKAEWTFVIAWIAFLAFGVFGFFTLNN